MLGTTCYDERAVIVSLLKLFALCVLAAAAVGLVRTWHMEHSKNQKLFLGGVVPNPAPDGLYRGSVSGPKVSWLGKRFSAATSRGINSFDDDTDGQREQYPFRTYVGKGLRDLGTDVFKIDYNVPENPWWLRTILDEIVEIDPGHYLGKVHVQLIPGYPFTLAYFELEK